MLVYLDAFFEFLKENLIFGICIPFFFWLLRPKDIIRFVQPVSLNKYLDSKNLRQNYKIVIVDDEPESFPVEYIRNLGFIVEVFEEISYADCEKLTKYDLVILDVMGVVKEDYEKGGAKVINFLKKQRNLLPVIAVSSGRFDAELNEYFKSSNDVLNKPIDEYKLKQTIEALKKEFYDVDEQLSYIDRKLNHHASGYFKKNKVKKLIIAYWKGEIHKEEINNKIHTLLGVHAAKFLNCVYIIKDRIEYA